MALEIERKFLVTSDAWRAQARSRELLRQGYLESGEHSSIRVRTAWLGEEVTHDQRYYNFNLAKRPYTEWS